MSALVAAAQAGAMSPIPPSFDGDERLFGLALWALTTLSLLALMFAGKQVRDMWRHRREDRLTDPMTVVRCILGLFAGALVLFCVPEVAYMLAYQPVETDQLRNIQLGRRVCQIIGATMAAAAMGTWVVTDERIVAQLLRQPIPIGLFHLLMSRSRSAGDVVPIVGPAALTWTGVLRRLARPIAVAVLSGAVSALVVFAK